MITSSHPQYELLDSGLGRKLELISGIKVNRPCPQAIWSPRCNEEEWNQASSVVIRTKDGGGRWEHKKPAPKDLTFSHRLGESELHFELRFTSFGHCGVFFEQIPVWDWLYQETLSLKNKLGRAPKIVNLFGYTGCASLVMAHAGAQVFHVDSSKGVLEWGRASQHRSRLPPESIRWVQSDAQEFLRHSFKKNFLYDGILADPPSWGHGVKKEVWDFEKHIHLLIEGIFSVLQSDNSFLFLSSHTPGVQSEALKNLVIHRKWKELRCGEFGLRHQNDSRILPAGIYVSAKSSPPNL